MWWRVVLLCLAYWLLGAHFLRYSHTIAAAICLLAPAVLFVKSAVVVRILQVGLLAGALLVWAKSGFEYVAMRQAMDAPGSGWHSLWAGLPCLLCCAPGVVMGWRETEVACHNTNSPQPFHFLDQLLNNPHQRSAQVK